MATDFLLELEYLGITARLKRLSDTLSNNIRELYKSEGIDIEPSWHLVFLILKDEPKTMTEVSEAFNISLPAIFKMAEKMRCKGYVDITKDTADSRKKILSLTKKTYEKLPGFEEIWNAGQSSMKDILKSNTDFLLSLQKLETELGKKNFKERAREKLKK